MLLGIISDTHGRVETTRQAIWMLESLDVQAVIHCGDIGSPEIPPLFQAWPTHFVFGNVDDDRAELRAVIVQAGHTCHERFGELELEGLKIAFLHGDDGIKFQQAVADGQYDLVCFGHTHVAEERRVGRTLILNPGAIHRARPHSFAVVELPALKVTNVPV